MKNKKVITALLLAALMSVSACGKKEKTDKFKKHLTNGEYQEALDYAKEHDVDLDDYTDEIKEQADLVMSEYLEGNASSAETIATLRILGNIAGEEGRDYIISLKEQIDELENAKYYFETAEDYFDSESYSYAMDYYAKVPEGTPYYEDAQKKIGEAEEKYLEQVFDDVDSYVANTYFDTALSKLEDAKKTFKNTKKIEEKIKEVEDAYRSYRIDKVDSDYDSWGDAGYAIDRLNDLLTDYPNDSDIKKKIEEYSDIYADEKLEKAKEWVENYNDYDYAVEIIEDALETVPGNKKLTDYLDEIAEMRPATFADLKMSGNGFKKADKDMDDTKAYTYPKDNTIYSPDGSDKEYTAEFDLGKKYSSLTAVAAPVTGFNKEAAVKLEVICDGTVVYTRSFEYDKYYDNLTIDLTGVSKLVFKVTPDGADKLDKTSLLISKAAFKKADENAEKPSEEPDQDTTEETTEGSTEGTTESGDQDTEAATTTAKTE